MLWIFGAPRRDELVSMDDFEETSKNVIVTLERTKNKKSRTFVIPKEGISFKIRPPNLETRRFFIAYRTGKCVKQVVGNHTIGKVSKKVLTFLKSLHWT